MITLTRKYTKIVLVNNLIESSMTVNSKESKTMNFGSVFRPLYHLSRVWGLAPFSIASNPNGELQNPKIGFSDGVWLLTTILIYLSFASYSLNAFQTARKTLNRGTWILILCARILALFAFVYGILTIIISLCNRFKLINIVKMFARFDEEVYQVKLDCFVSFLDVVAILTIFIFQDGKDQNFFQLQLWLSPY